MNYWLLTWCCHVTGREEKDVNGAWDPENQGVGGTLFQWTQGMEKYAHTKKTGVYINMCTAEWFWVYVAFFLVHVYSKILT